MTSLPGVLLIYPATKAQASPPLGILYIASYLEKKGIPIKVIDCSLYGTTDIVNKVLQQHKPSIVGISLLLTPLYPNAREIIKAVKKFDKDTWVILGGIHPTALPRESLQDTEADIVVLGEGEYTVWEICQKFPYKNDLNQVDGIAFKEDDGRIVLTAPRKPINIKDLDELPFPARHLVDMSRYFSFKWGDRINWSLPQPALPIIASRGCPFRCTFCASSLVHGKKIRYRSPENVRNEVQQLIGDYGIKGVYFYDDTLTLNRDWLFRLCDLLQELKVKWICGTRVDQVDEEKLTRMKKSGCVLISYGIESGDERILNSVLRKDIDLSQVKYIFSLTKKAEIQTIANFMLGVPGDTEQTMQKTIDFSKEIKANAAEFSIYNPLPGTELAAIAQQASTSFQTDFGKYDYARPVFETSSLSAETIQKYHNKAVKGFYLRPAYLLQKLRGIRSFDDVKRCWSGLKSFTSLLRRIRRKR